MSSKIRTAFAAALALAACSSNPGADAGAFCDGGCPLNESCVSGSCQCLTGFLPCTIDGGQACVDVLLDKGNCGACGQACPQAEDCLDGTCQCVSPSVLCGSGADGGGVCSDFETDPQNCGACGQPCLPNETCVGALCNCPSGDTLCDLPDGGQVCTDLSSDPQNCGACASDCDGGSCVCDPVTQICAPSFSGGPGVCGCSSSYPTPCPPNGACVDTNGDPQNCGSCGNVCPTGICASGVCACTAPYTNCPSGSGSNVCTDLETDPRHCGGCGNDCTLLGVSGAACQNKTCTCPLDAGSGTICSENGAAACVDVASDPQNCGHCGSPCNPPTTACASGQCACPGQDQLCGAAGAQACVSLTTDPLNCGSCGYDCSVSYAADAGCNQGSCGCSDVQTLCITQRAPPACGCEAASGAGACVQPTLAFADVAPILTDATSLLGCATSGCHSAAAHAGGLDLSTAAAAYAGLLGSPDAGPSAGSCGDAGPNGTFGNVPSTACPCTARVVPGVPSSSFLIQVVRDSAFCAAGQPMPIDSDGGFHPLSACQVQLLTTWVQQGAVGP
ncbi:MAG: hypothetical protein ACYDCL_12760 [Myxococcales bacterium]